MKSWSKHWKSSKQARKQRKYRFNAPLHVARRLLGAHLSNELVKKHNTRSMSVVKGDKVKVAVGDYKGHVGKVDDVNIKMNYIIISGMTAQKKDGNTVAIKINPSNVIITELNLSDKKRSQILERKGSKSTVKKSVVKEPSTKKQSKKNKE